jgi:hypothetical protein
LPASLSVKDDKEREQKKKKEQPYGDLMW